MNPKQELSLAPGAVAAVAPSRSRRRPIAAAVATVALAALGLRLTVLAPGRTADEGRTTGTTTAAQTEDPDCLAAGHVDIRVTGLTPDLIPLLPADYSYFNLTDDRCSPVRWNPCEPVHFAV
ncbi:MAG: hypothetical protein ABIW46_01740, partial [Acidimicrobiales bacterium]